MKPRIMILIAALFASPAFGAEHPSGFPAELNTRPGNQDFLSKLQELLTKTDKSIQLVRNQITASTNAPFLPDLYQQLGELLLQKANGLYFLRMEKFGKAAASSGPDRQLSNLQNEAIQVFDRILGGFPNYSRRANTLFLLATTLKAAENSPRFIETVNAMIRDFPKDISTFRARLLMAQYLSERHINDEALKHLLAVRQGPFVFEKNLARYRSALIMLEMDKPRESLALFEEVVNDPDLDQVKPDASERSLMLDSGSENLKREALIDSVRAYTFVYAKDPKPVEYYLKLAPSESLFQETIEKLAFRYVTLKQYPNAIVLFRALSERISDPQKVLNIYRQVLVSIPPQDRLNIPPAEMERVAQKFNRWTAYYRIDGTTRQSAYNFFETQIRDLGTRSHEASKHEKNPQKKAALLAQAHDYYLLYLRFFRKTRYTSLIGTNLADVEFNQKDYFHGGETYYRTYLGDFGPPKQKNELLKNAIFSLQQKAPYTFYEQLRGRALLVKAIDSYLRDNPSLRADPKLNFVRIKTTYEQGFYNSAIPQLYRFISRNPNTPYTADATDLIFDYYNTISDMKGLTTAAGKLLAMNLPNPKLNERIRSVKMAASFKRVEKNIETTAGYGNAGASKQYLQAALSSGDTALMDAALKEALNLSKTERDIETFFKTANTFVGKERKAGKKAELLSSIVSEYIKLTRFVTADKTLQGVGRLGASGDAAQKAFAERVRIALLRRDMRTLAYFAESPEWASVDEDLKKRARAMAIDYLVSGAVPPPSLIRELARDLSDENNLQTLYHSKSLLPGQLRQEVSGSIQNLCSQRPQSAICRWNGLAAAESGLGRFVAGLSSSPLTPESIEPKGNEFVQIDKLYREIENSGDPYLDSLVMIKSRYLYSKFADFLLRIGGKNPSLLEPLRQKANESKEAASKFQQSCQNIVISASLPGRYSGYCTGSENVAQGLTIDSFLARQPRSFHSSSSKDPMSKTILDLQKKVFAEDDTANSLLALAREYLRAGEFSHAAGAASYGLALNMDSSEDLKVVLGCALNKLGFISEAKFQLGGSKSTDPQKTQCLSEANRS